MGRFFSAEEAGRLLRVGWTMVIAITRGILEETLLEAAIAL